MSAVIGSDINGYHQFIGRLFAICKCRHAFDHCLPSTLFRIQNVFIAHLLKKLEHTVITVVGVGPW
jgi:hypothetical protein